MDDMQEKIADVYGNYELDSDLGGMFLSDMAMLNIIVKRPIRLNKLAKETGYTPQSVGRHCGRMAKTGILEVTTDRRDKRAKLAVITKKGATLQARCFAFLASHANR